MGNNHTILTSFPEPSVQINDGFTQTSADGASLAFDSRYGIMFCAYMPGFQGNYGESRGKIALSYFPASQPTNIRFVTVWEGDDVYCPNILGLGDGRVRVFYEKNSRAEGDHTWCYRDFDFLTGKLSEEDTVMVRTPWGETCPLCLSVQFGYLEERGYHQHQYVKTEQIGHCAYFTGEDGMTYGACVNYFSEPILFRSADQGATVEFFAVFPHPAQYEFEYKIKNGIFYAIYRTNKDTDAIAFVTSGDSGRSWSEPRFFPGSIQCRPRLIPYRESILMCYNYLREDTGRRPPIQQGRTAIRMVYGEEMTPVADLHQKYGMVNVCITDVLGDVYLAYSTSELALEYQNGNPLVRGKDTIR
ncbi:MAG: exo-alpha-sialidase, partial [Clostridia bacterium]|nr:exo-alpha-sialidase [Clostridia bacterium]